MNSRTKGIVAYILIVFAMAWILWGVAIRLGLSLQSPLTQLVILPGAFSPAVAAFVVRKWITGEGFADAGLRLNLRAKWPYYLVAWLLPLGVTLAIVVLSVAFGVDQPDFSLQRAFKTLVPGGGQMPSFAFGLLVLQAMVTSLIATPLLWGEEFGWRGYLQIRLLSRRPLLAAIATGIIWGIWHIPLNLRGYNFPDRPILGLFAFPVSAVLLSIIFGWLRQKTGSVWSASLAHAATNAIGGSLTMLLFVGGPSSYLVTYLGLLGWIPLGIVCAWIILSGQLQPRPVFSGQAEPGGRSR